MSPGRAVSASRAALGSLPVKKKTHCPLWGAWQGSPAASWPQAAKLELQTQPVGSVCLIQGAVASGAPEQAGRDTQCCGSDSAPWAVVLNQGSLKEGFKRKLLDGLGLVHLVPCWELAGGTELWKLLCQVKPGALGVQESFASGLSCAKLSSSWYPLHLMCRSCVLGCGWCLQMSHGCF